MAHGHPPDLGDLLQAQHSVLWLHLDGVCSELRATFRRHEVLVLYFSKSLLGPSLSTRPLEEDVRGKM